VKRTASREDYDLAVIIIRFSSDIRDQQTAGGMNIGLKSTGN
jgi:hypothetical protein